MIVQPASIDPGPRPRRILRVVALAAPVALLAGVVGIGLLGPSPQPDPRPPIVPTSAPAAVAGEAVSPSPRDVEEPAKVVRFPSRVAGLDVHGVEWTLEARSRGLARSGVLAVAGYLALDEPADCVGSGLGVVVPFCERTGILAERPWSGSSGETELPPYHLHPQVPSGVRVPYLAATAARVGRPSQPVVLLARFDDGRARPCIPAGRHCGQELVVERIAWIDGVDFPRTVTVDPGVSVAGRADDEVRRQAAYAVSSFVAEGYPLLAVLVRPETLADMHPEAAATLAPEQPVWYVRGLHEAGNPGRIDWLVVDAENERMLAWGEITTIP